MLIRILIFSLYNDYEYIFEFINQINLIFFIYIINNKMIDIFVKNNFDYQIKIPRKFRLDAITKIDYENYF